MIVSKYIIIYNMHAPHENMTKIRRQKIIKLTNRRLIHKP